MARDLQSLCREYLGSSSPATRAKAAAVLAADGSEASAAALADALLVEPDAGTREQVLEAIYKLDEAAREVAMTRLGQALADPARQVVAHDSLTRLSHRGVAVPGGQRSFTERLRLAWTVRRAGPRTFAATSRWSFGFALLGAVLTLFLIAVKAATEKVSWTLLAVVFAAMLVVATWLARAVCAGVRRGDSYFDRRAGWAVELVTAALEGLPTFALLGALMLTLWPSLTMVSPLTAVGLGLGVLGCGFVFTASIRLATLSCSALVRRSWVHTWLGAGAGWGAGITVATVAFLLLRWGVGQVSAPPEIIALAAGFWLFALPTAASVGAAFARLERLERDAAAPRRTRREAWLWVPSVLAGVLLVSGWAWFFWARAPIETITAAVPGPVRSVEPCSRAPVQQRIEVEEGEQRLRAHAVQSSTRLTLKLWDQDVLLEQGPSIERLLPPGKYRLEAIDPQAPIPTLRAELFDLAKRLAWQEKRKQQDGSPLRLCSDSRFYALGAQPVEGVASFDLEIELDAQPAPVKE